MKDFIETFQASRSFYGYIEDTTLASLMLCLLPTSPVHYMETQIEINDDTDINGTSNKVFIVSTMLKSLKDHGFHFSTVSLKVFATASTTLY